MESPEFLDDFVANEIYTGKFGRLGELFPPLDTFPEVIQKWVLENYPGTTHVRIGPSIGLTDKMQWWMGGWVNPTLDKKYTPDWETKMYTQYRKL